MDFWTVLKWIVSTVGMVILTCSAAFGHVHTYSGHFDLRIPADPDVSKGWMQDAVADVPDHLIISDLDVRIDVTHTHAFDLQIFLQSPAGTRICLNMYNLDEFFWGENYTDTIFDDEAQIPIEQGGAPFTGRFKPREPYRLEAFDGQDCFGSWRLQIYDAFWADTGRLNSFELIITAIQPPKVIALAATEVGRTNATLSGLVVDDGGEPCRYRFSYWTHGYYCCTEWSDPCDAKSTGQSFGQPQIGLAPGIYYFTAQARNSAGEGDWATPECFSIVRPFSGSGSGTEADPYIITNVRELQQVNNDLSACYELANDIDGSDTRTWLGGYGFTPIGRYSTAFRGVFDGKGHFITGLYVNRDLTFCTGLFGCAEESEIRNVGLVDAAITGWTCTGGLVAINKGVIEGCYVTGDVNGVAKVGGLVGLNSGLIQNCYSTANVSGGPQGFYIAGLVGQNSGGILENCYSTGPVDGNDCGGLVARCGPDLSQCNRCFWDTETSGQPISACGIGKTTAQMQTWLTFAEAGWDFLDTWVICEHAGYPKLAWQISAGDVLCPDGVDMADFAFFAAHWRANHHGGTTDGGDNPDLDHSGTVDAGDLQVFSNNWLAGSSPPL